MGAFSRQEGAAPMNQLSGLALRGAASRPLQHDKVIEGQNSARGSHSGGVTRRVVPPPRNIVWQSHRWPNSLRCPCRTGWNDVPF
jgi:hypothetical protein